jgi:predicted amidohydrolase
VSTFKIALVQTVSHGADPTRATRLGEWACRQAAARGADLVLFPELWQLGYAACPRAADARDAWLAHATDVDGTFVGRFCALARELRVAVAITYLQRWPGGPRNAATVIDRHGDPVLTYAKVHTCDFSMEAAMTPGDGFPVAELDLGGASVRVGVMICYDREFPESARALMLGGAEVILVPNACPIDTDRLGQLRARAFENMVGVAMANYAALPPGGGLAAGEDAPWRGNGHSAAFSGIYCDATGRPLDHKLVEAGEHEQLLMASFDLDGLRAYRQREMWGDAYRKPAAYGALVEDAPHPVFARQDSRRTHPAAASLFSSSDEPASAL